MISVPDGQSPVPPLCKDCRFYKRWDTWGDCKLDVTHAKVYGEAIGCIYFEQAAPGEQEVE